MAARLRSALPSQQDVARGSEWGVLQREIQKKSKHKAVRQLVEEIPTALTSLTPCFMMSPLSIAHYLPANHSVFDVVIFDEASQITVWDAVGAIARGRQTIMVGDPKQMPPTNFFNRSEDDPDGDVESEGDLESILDEMLGSSVPYQTLNWHYRSRRESLIAFSNHRYYEGSLVTFPGPSVEDKGVYLRKIDGHYARGAGRHNEIEAKAVVDECVRRLSSTDDGTREQSIGIVTFNSEQQNLIENLLDAARAKNPGLEWAFSEDGGIEPVFVKNLETVQGDERDVILFSVTYGPDISGHVTMNFGPLNKSGGERRLNVAITRARSEMVVFSTLEANQIDLSRSQAHGVADLKHFLEYAEKGPSSLGSFVSRPLQDFESPFEMAVAEGLKRKGWDVHSQIGVSAYRIDLGIVHPDKSGLYLAGVECDGASYHSSATAKDRDKIRQSVLEGLGWRLLRIWSSDWWTNKSKSLDLLNAALSDLLEEEKKRSDAEVANDASGRPSNTAPLVEEQITEADSVSAEATQDEPRSQLRDQQLTLVSDDEGDLPGQVPDALASANLSPSSEQQDTSYRYADLDNSNYIPEPSLFYDPSYKRRLRAMIDIVIDSEGPIHEDVLVHRIARHHGFQRAGRQIKEIVVELAKQRRGRTKEGVGLFFWRKGTVKERLAPARIHGREGEVASIDRISMDEIRAISEKLRTSDPIDIARSMGTGRLSASARQRIARAFL